ncbi:MAG: T9SS type A sorting domain-containing protein [Bacteroidetes bacterium]|nr:T9SS type A sorting domain-containing protein [Bacteroidota bacterium]
MKTMIIFLLSILAIVPNPVDAQSMQKINFSYDETGNREVRIKAIMLNESDTAFNNPVFPPYENPLLSENSFEIAVHPIPAITHLTISFSKAIPQGFDYIMFDQLGKPVAEGHGMGNDHRLEMATYQSGVYYLQIRTADKVMFRYKIVKN